VDLVVLYRFCSPSDYHLLALGLLGSLGSGAQRPVSVIILGNILEALSSGSSVLQLLRWQCIYYCESLP